MTAVVAAHFVASGGGGGSTPTDAWADAPTIDLTTAPHVVVQGNNTGFTTETNEPTTVAGWTTTKTAWIKFVSPITGKIGLSLRTQGGTTTPFDALMAVYTGSSLATLTQVAAYDAEQFNFAATAGTTYYVQVGGYGGGAGAWDLHITTNNDLANAWPLTATSGTHGPYFEAALSLDAGEPTIDGNTAGTAWYKVTVGATGGAAQFDTIGSSALAAGSDSLIAVYTSSSPSSPTYASLTQVAWDDNSGGATDAKITPTLTAGTVYFVQVMPARAAGSFVRYKMNWSVPSV